MKEREREIWRAIKRNREQQRGERNGESKREQEADRERQTYRKGQKEAERERENTTMDYEDLTGTLQTDACSRRLTISLTRALDRVMHTSSDKYMGILDS